MKTIWSDFKQVCWETSLVSRYNHMCTASFFCQWHRFFLLSTSSVWVFAEFYRKQTFLCPISVFSLAASSLFLFSKGKNSILRWRRRLLSRWMGSVGLCELWTNPWAFVDWFLVCLLLEWLYSSKCIRSKTKPQTPLQSISVCPPFQS
jgi:hypothetical protein